jgi:glyoxylase-like metal-dependent hydrolase (beta-lactamase superfamily II)
MVLETHAHADHLSGAPYIKLKTGAKVAIGEHIRDVQRIFRPVFNAMDVSGDGSEFDHLFKDGEHFKIGTIDAQVIYTPGHTPACVSYKIGDAVFGGDTMFMPDFGTARADFRRRCAHALPLDQAHLVAPAGDAAVHVPRLQGAWLRALCLGDHGRRGARAQCARARRRLRGRLRQDAHGARCLWSSLSFTSAWRPID